MHLITQFISKTLVEVPFSPALSFTTSCTKGSELAQKFVIIPIGTTTLTGMKSTSGTASVYHLIAKIYSHFMIFFFFTADNPFWRAESLVAQEPGDASGT